MGKVSAPCKNCTDRVVGCHSKCERYQAYHADRVKVGELMDKSYIYSDYKVDMTNKWNGWRYQHRKR